jgi:hypothetical protein
VQILAPQIQDCGRGRQQSSHPIGATFDPHSVSKVDLKRCCRFTSKFAVSTALRLNSGFVWTSSMTSIVSVVVGDVCCEPRRTYSSVWATMQPPVQNKGLREHAAAGR